MNILTYIGIAIGGLIAVGSTLGITLGIVVTIIYKYSGQLNIKFLYLTNLNKLTMQSDKYTVSWQYNIIWLNIKFNELKY